MQAFKVGKLVTFVAIIILLVVAILSPYSLFKKIYFIIGVLIIGAISLGANKFLNWYIVNLTRNDITYVIGNSKYE